jgi:subtilisin family serine protease
MESGSEFRPLRLRSGTLLGPHDDAGLPRRLLMAEEDVAGGGPALLQLGGPLDGEIREALTNAGIDLAVFIGGSGYIALLPEGGLDKARAVRGIEWAAPYHPGLRLSPAIAAIAIDDARATIPLSLTIFPESDPQPVVDRLRQTGLAVGGSARGRAGRPGRIVILPSPADVVLLRESLASWPEVLWIGRRPVYRLLNDASAWVGQSGLDAAQATPLYDNGIYGDGQIVGVLDTGLDADMCHFYDDALGLPPANVGFATGSPDPDQRKVLVVNFLWSADDPGQPWDWDSHDHGTHVAGTIAGDNPLSPGSRDSADGMAPAAKLVIQDGGFGTDNCADMPAIGCPAADLYPFFEQAFLQGARIHSNSYGDRENYTPYNIYSDGSEAADAFMWDHPEFLLVFAAGNNGPGSATVASPATAKNVLAVGATNHGISAGTLASFSSHGPTQDGRIKPDVTAPGHSIISADNDNNTTTYNCSSRSMSGTSMACPTAAGLAALAREYFTKGYYPTGTPTPGNAVTPSAALLKATLIASATPMEGELSPPPSDPQGWGRILLDDALFFPQDDRRLFAADAADGFGSPGDPPDSYDLEILNSAEPLRVVLAWTDYPSNPAASINLVNDLNLEVQSPSGDVYLGNVFSGGVSVTGGSADYLNNVEAVRIESPEIGSWTIRVDPHAIPQPAQGYGLVATGGFPVSGVFLERVVLVIDDSIGGNGNGVMEPGEWIDLPLDLMNSGDSEAINVVASLESLTSGVEVVRSTTALPDMESNEQASSAAPHLRIHLTADLPCSSPFTLRFTYSADGFLSAEESFHDTGSETVLLYDDLESQSGWSHVRSESTASTGDWLRDDPDGTDYQPEDDVTPDPGSKCLFTARNPGGIGSDDVDSGVVVARSGSYDIEGHPEARLRISRWFANRASGADGGDYFRLEIREDSGAPDVLLEELDYTESAAYWETVEFRVADHVPPGPDIELKVSAADGPAIGNIIEAAIDDIVFWEPVCEVYNPAPNVVDTLTASLEDGDILLQWNRPPPDPLHGEADRYGIYRSQTASGGYALLHELADASPSLGYTDTGASGGAPLYFYQVIAGNDAGDAEPSP